MINRTRISSAFSGMRRRAGAALMALTAAPMLMSAQGSHTDIDDRLLNVHNRERAALGLKPLAWDAALERSAQKWAAKLARKGVMQHSTAGSGFGENLWAGTKGFYEAEAMVGSWVAEKANFKAGTFPAVSKTGRFEDVGHYTQVVWRDTNRVGCAVASGEQFDFLVCQYARPGNVMGQKVY